jgi:hypothetical protein
MPNAAWYSYHPRANCDMGSMAAKYGMMEKQLSPRAGSSQEKLKISIDFPPSTELKFLDRVIKSH